MTVFHGKTISILQFVCNTIKNTTMNERIKSTKKVVGTLG